MLPHMPHVQTQLRPLVTVEQRPPGTVAAGARSVGPQCCGAALTEIKVALLCVAQLTEMACYPRRPKYSLSLFLFTSIESMLPVELCLQWLDSLAKLC